MYLTELSSILPQLAVGVWTSLEEVASRWRVERVFEPRMERGCETEQAAGNHEEARSLQQAFERGDARG